MKKQKIKVLHLPHSINLGGGARNVRTFYKYCPKNVDFHVIALVERGEKYTQFKKVCKKLHFAGGDYKYVFKYVLKNKIDLVHFHGTGYFTDLEYKIAESLKKEGVKIVYTNIFGDFDTRSDKLIDFYIFKSNHCLVEKLAKNSGINVLNKDSYKRYMVIPNPVDYKYFESIRPSKKQIEDYKKEIAIPKDYNVIGKVGARKAVEKWSDLILYMFPYVLKKHPNTILLIQGLPDSRRKWVSKFGDKVRLLPQTNDDKQLALMYNVLDIFTHASKIGEHSGNSINESMYWGKPVIVNLTPKKDNGQFEQVVHGKNGYFANTPIAYANKVNYLLSNKNTNNKMSESSYINTKDVYPEKLWVMLESCYRFCIFGDNKSELIEISKSLSDYHIKYLEDIAAFNTSIYNIRFICSQVYWKIADYIGCKYKV